MCPHDTCIVQGGPSSQGQGDRNTHMEGCTGAHGRGLKEHQGASGGSSVGEGGPRACGYRGVVCVCVWAGGKLQHRRHSAAGSAHYALLGKGDWLWCTLSRKYTPEQTRSVRIELLIPSLSTEEPRLSVQSMVGNPTLLLWLSRRDAIPSVRSSRAPMLLLPLGPRENHRL